MDVPKKKRDTREGEEPLKRQNPPPEPQRRENPEERRPEEWDPGDSGP